MADFVSISLPTHTQAVAQTMPQPQPTPTIPLTREQRLALVPTPKSLVAHLDQHVIGQGIAKQRIAVGVSNHFKRIVDSIEPDDPIVTDADLKNVRIEKSNILLIGPFGLGKSHLVRFPGFLSERAPGRQ